MNKVGFRKIDVDGLSSLDLLLTAEVRVRPGHRTLTPPV
jgi:hypothetical protein